jgi:hypothetical protein
MSVESTGIVIPSNPADLKKIFGVIKEISNSKTRASAEGDYQTEAIKALAEEFSIDAKHLKRMANDYHKQQFEKKANEFDEYSALYEKVVAQSANVSVDDEEENV